jgi:hypothetical protein
MLNRQIRELSKLTAGLLVASCVGACAAPSEPAVKAPETPPATSRETPPPAPISTEPVPTMMAPLVKADYKRTGGKLTLTITVENASNGALEKVKVDTFTLNGKKVAGFPLSFGKLAPKQKATKTLPISGFKKGDVQQKFTTSFVQPPPIGAGSSETSGTVTIP